MADTGLFPDRAPPHGRKPGLPAGLPVGDRLELRRRHRALSRGDSWTVVFWRSLWAAAFLLGFMLWRDGARGTLRLFRGMGLPGLAVALCFAIASTASSSRSPTPRSPTSC